MSNNLHYADVENQASYRCGHGFERQHCPWVVCVCRDDLKELEAHRAVIAKVKKQLDVVLEMDAVEWGVDSLPEPDSDQVVRIDRSGSLPAPTEDMLKDALFNRIWECIKEWEIGGGVATGNHARAIMEALA
jgi:hypothetical protein